MQVIKVMQVDRQLFELVKPPAFANQDADRLTAEASRLGFKPGEWPRVLEVVDGETVSTFTLKGFVKPGDDVESAVYTGAGKTLVEIFND